MDYTQESAQVTLIAKDNTLTLNFVRDTKLAKNIGVTGKYKNRFFPNRRVFCGVVSYLLSQLPCRSQDQSLGAFHFHIDLLKDGNCKGGSLSSARLGLSDHIIS